MIRFITFCLCLFSFLHAGAEEKVDVLRQKAESGDAAAQFKLADEYFYGTGTRKQNHTLAAHWFRMAANKGVTEAMFNYALCLDQGLGVERDPFKAAEYYAKAAEKKTIPHAVFNHALILRDGVTCKDEKDRKKKPEGYTFTPDPEKAWSLIRELAEKKYPPAMTEWAEHLLQKKETSGDKGKRIFQLLTDAAKSPHAPPETHVLLADCYFNGTGTLPDGKKMIQSLENGVAAGDTTAALKLAYWLEMGIYVEKQDPERALTLYRAAAKAGIPEALVKVGDAVSEGKIPDIKKENAAEYYRLAASAKHPKAWFRLGELVEPEDRKKAAEFYYESARLGYPRAQYRVGMFFLEKDGPMGYDPTAAVYWFQQGMKNNDAPSMRALAVCLYHGNGCEPDRNAAMLLLRKAAENGDVRAMDMIKRGAMP